MDRFFVGIPAFKKQADLNQSRVNTHELFDAGRGRVRGVYHGVCVGRKFSGVYTYRKSAYVFRCLFISKTTCAFRSIVSCRRLKRLSYRRTKLRIETNNRDKKRLNFYIHLISQCSSRFIIVIFTCIYFNTLICHSYPLLLVHGSLFRERALYICCRNGQPQNVQIGLGEYWPVW